MASQDTDEKTSESAVSTTIANIAGKGVKPAPTPALLSICKSLVAGGVAGGV
ncbi:hypothetical protein SESBI_17697 [Sesbania bispinosa]|nr:hypothetical protein SESBI_17697 [Sesbania bispinosa]